MTIEKYYLLHTPTNVEELLLLYLIVGPNGYLTLRSRSDSKLLLYYISRSDLANLALNIGLFGFATSFRIGCQSNT